LHYNRQLFLLHYAFQRFCIKGDLCKQTVRSNRIGLPSHLKNTKT
jgi:hypothetical protein